MNTTKFKTVIVGVDFSDYSKVVAKQAIKLAEAYNAKLVFIHALSSAIYTSSHVMFADLVTDIVNPMRQEVRSFYKLEGLKERPKILVELGTASDLIISEAKRSENPLIVVGHKGQSGLGRFFLGSNAERLALHSPCPVWVHRGNSVRLPEKILVPCDFSPRTEKSYNLAKEIGAGAKSKFEFYHVQQLPVPILDAENFRKAMRKFKDFEGKKKRQFAVAFPRIPLKAIPGEPAPSIAKESRKFDLIAMAPHNREGLFSSFGSVTAKVVRNGNVPVLITH